MRLIATAPILLLCLSTVTRADVGNLRCKDLDLASVRSTLVKHAENLYPESRDTVNQWVEKSKNDPDPSAACKNLTSARDFLARIEGPRVLDIEKPDPKNYPQRFSNCTEPNSTRKKIDK